jgi:hypothetical protein
MFYNLTAAAKMKLMTSLTDAPDLLFSLISAARNSPGRNPSDAQVALQQGPILLMGKSHE